MADDPMSMVYDALWELAEAWTPLTSLVKVGNRIKFSGDNRDPVKRQVSDADLPELVLGCTAFSPHMLRTSCGSSMDVTFEWMISAGDQRLDAALFPVVWELHRAMIGWMEVLAALTWKSKQFVKLTRALTGNVGMSNPELNRGITGWSSIWSCELQMWFQTVDLQQE